MSRSCRGIEGNRTRDRGIENRRANHETTSRGRCVSKEIARRHSESASTRTISADGSPRLRQICAGPQRERIDTHDLCRGRARTAEIVKQSPVFAHRPRRASRANHKNRKTSAQFLRVDHANPRRESCAQIRDFEIFSPIDHANPRRGSHAQVGNLKKSTVFLHLDHANFQGGFGPTAPPQETNQLLSCRHVSCKFGCVMFRCCVILITFVSTCLVQVWLCDISLLSCRHVAKCSGQFLLGKKMTRNLLSHASSGSQLSHIL